MRAQSRTRAASFGYCHSYETSSRYDGPGLRVVLFLSGCLLRCTYCHNPDTWHLKDGTYVSVDQVLRRIADFAPSLRALGGGLTISGGEPMVQLAFTRRIFAGAKSMGLHTAIETSGFLGDRADESYLSDGRPRSARHQELGSGNLPASNRTRYGAHAALRRASGVVVKARLGPLHAGAWRDRRPRQCRRHCTICRADEERRMGGGAAVPPDGFVQMEGDGPRIQARKYPAADAAIW